MRTDPALHTTTEMRDDAAVARQVVSLRVDPTELASWKRAAKAAGIPLGEYIRRRVTGEQTIRIEAPPPPKPAKRGGR